MKEDNTILFASVGDITKASRLFELQNYAKMECLDSNNPSEQENPQNEGNTCFVEDNDPADCYF